MFFPLTWEKILGFYSTEKLRWSRKFALFPLIPVFENKNKKHESSHQYFSPLHLASPYLTDLIFLYKIIHIYCYEVPFMTPYHDFLHICKINSFIPFSQMNRISCYLIDTWNLGSNRAPYSQKTCRNIPTW